MTTFALRRDATGLTSEDFRHTANLLRTYGDAVRAATASNNHNIILAALDLAAHAFDENQINASETPNALDLAAALENRGEQDFYALLDALREWPKLPSPYLLHLIGGQASDYSDWERGKKIQNELGPEVIPFTCECEKGAGFWDRITGGAWKDAQCLGKEVIDNG